VIRSADYLGREGHDSADPDTAPDRYRPYASVAARDLSRTYSGRRELQRVPLTSRAVDHHPSRYGPAYATLALPLRVQWLARSPNIRREGPEATPRRERVPSRSCRRPRHFSHRVSSRHGTHVVAASRRGSHSKQQLGIDVGVRGLLYPRSDIAAESVSVSWQHVTVYLSLLAADDRANTIRSLRAVICDDPAPARVAAGALCVRP